MVRGSFGLPPVVACPGTRASQATGSRLRRNAFASPTAATSAIALVGPIPGVMAQEQGGRPTRDAVTRGCEGGRWGPALANPLTSSLDAKGSSAGVPDGTGHFGVPTSLITL